MKIIDRYILRQFALNFVILMVVAQGLFVGIDFIVNLDSYLRAAKAAAAADQMPRILSLFGVLFDYYGPMCLLLYVYLSGIVVAAAMGFTVVNLQRTRELTAVVASGVSLRRVAMVLAAGSLAANLLAAPVQEWVIPRIAHKALRSRGDLVRGGGGGEPVRMLRVSEQGKLLCADAFDFRSGAMRGVRILERDAGGNRLGDLRAEAACWDAAAGAWVFEPAATVTAGSRDGLAAPATEPVVLWKTDFSPAVIHGCRNTSFAALLSLGEMNAFSAIPTLSEDFRANLRRAWWMRFSMPLFGTLLTLVTLSALLSRVPVITLKQGLTAALLSLGCWAFGIGAMTAQFLPPFVAAFLPVAAIGALVLWRMRRMET